MAWSLRVYLAVLALLVAGALLPEPARVFPLHDRSLLRALLAVCAVGGVYLASAFAIGEIAVEGEKALADLATTAFSPRTIVWGKVGTALLTAAALLLLSLPLFLFAAPDIPRGLALACLSVGMALAALGAVGTWLAAAVPGDLARTLVHWALLVLLFTAPLTLGRLDPLGVAVSPLRLGRAAVDGEARVVLAGTALYALVLPVTGWLMARAVVAARQEVASWTR